MQLEKYLDLIQLDYNLISYEIYCESLDLVFENKLTEGFFDNIRNMSLPREFLRVFSDMRTQIEKIAKEFKLGLPDVVAAFKEKQFYEILKSFKFNIGLIFRCISELSKAVRGGLIAIFKELYKTRAIQKLRSGAIKIDDILNKYPKLKKVGGVVIAGLLLYLWLNMTFIGDLDYDFNFSDISNSLSGSFSIADLFVSPEGLMLLTLFGSGAALGLSIPWLGKSAYNFALAIFYTVYNKNKGKDFKFKDTINRLKKAIKMERLK